MDLIQNLREKGESRKMLGFLVTGGAVYWQMQNLVNSKINVDLDRWGKFINSTMDMLSFILFVSSLVK
jgi:hypothetical protein